MFSNRFYDTDELRTKDREHIIHPWEDLGIAATRPTLVIAEAEGVHVHDSTGHRMLDGIGGLWCVNIGYGRREMAAAIAEQAERLCYFSPFTVISNPPSIELAHRLAAYAPGDLSHVFFTTGGSTAVDSALRFVQFYFNFIGQPHKKHIISREYAFHGSTYLTASVSGKPGDRGNLDFITDTIHHLPAPNPYRMPEGMSEQEFCDRKVAELENKILELGADNVACFIAEPLLASGGVIVPPKGYQKRTLDVCRRHGVLYISDEVVTGFGRLGHIFASEPEFGLLPDIITTAKGLTSGYVPLGAFIVSDGLYRQVTGANAKGKLFANGYTYSGHPVACAAGLKNLEIMESEDICGHVRTAGPYFVERLRSLLDLPLVGDVRGSHMMVCVECVRDTRTKEVPPEEWEVAWRIARHAMARGLLVRPLGHQLVLSPPLIITRAQIDEAVDHLRGGIMDTMEELTREGLWYAA